MEIETSHNIIHIIRGYMVASPFQMTSCRAISSSHTLLQLVYLHRSKVSQPKPWNSRRLLMSSVFVFKDIVEKKNKPVRLRFWSMLSWNSLTCCKYFFQQRFMSLLENRHAFQFVFFKQQQRIWRRIGKIRHCADALLIDIFFCGQWNCTH